MSRPVSVPRILVLLGVLVAAGCRSEGGSGGPGAGASAPPPVDESRWMWVAPEPSWTGMPAADDREVALTYGHHALVLLDAAGRERWRAPRVGLRDVAPRLTADLVLAATEEGLAAFRRADGSPVWDTAVGGRIRTNTPVVAGGVAVTSSWEGQLVALDMVTGSVVWRVDLPGPAFGPPTTDGTAVVASWDKSGERSGGVVAVEASTGRQRWAVAVPGGGVSAPAVTASGNAVLVAGDLTARALALASGKEQWRTGLDGAGSPEVPPAPVGEGKVLVAHRSGGLDLLDAATGTVEWQLATDGAVVRGGPVVGRDGASFALALDDGRLVKCGPGKPTEIRRAPNRLSGLAAGPAGVLVVAERGAPVNTVQATPDW
jgi:outer membrane protein assembly factor BamB